jgi:hypothetical protein
VERQRQHRSGIVGIEPGSLLFAGAESEEVLEDLLVGDDTGQQADQHDHGGNAHDPAGPQAVQPVEFEMKAVEEAPAPRFAGLDQFAGAGIHHRPLHTLPARRCAGHAPGQLHTGVALTRQGD